MKTKILGLLAVGLLAGLASSAASAFVVTVTGLSPGSLNGNWNISLVTDNEATLALMQAQPWWGSQAASIAFSEALACGLGCEIPVPELGISYPPFFAWDEYYVTIFYPQSNTAASSYNPNGINGAFTYAVAQRVVEPGTLALLGLGLAGLGLSRRRRAH